jgi:hypothetical protein
LRVGCIPLLGRHSSSRELSSATSAAALAV